MLWPLPFVGVCTFLLLAKLAHGNTVKLVFQIIALLLFVVVAGQLRLWWARLREAEWRGLGRRVGAEFVSKPSDLLERFAHNPWQCWPEESADVIAKYALRTSGRVPEFYVLELDFNTTTLIETASPFTVTFAIVRLNTALAARHLQERMIPERFGALVTADYLYLYRTSSQRYPADRLFFADISDAIVKATTLAAELESLATQALIVRHDARPKELR